MRIRGKIFENIISLLSINVLGYAISFVSFPWLTRVLGVANFGLMNYAMGLCVLINVFVAYSFGFTASRDIAVCRDNNEKCMQVFSSVFYTKILLMMISAVAYFGVLFVFFQNSDYLLYAASFLVVVGEAIFPAWFFQGIEKMKFITYFVTMARLVSLLCILLFVRTHDDFVLAAFFQSSTTVFAGICSLIYLFTTRREFLRFPQSSLILYQLRQGIPYFYSNVLTNIYTKSSIVVLGLFTTNEMVGYYSIAVKFMNASKQVIDTVGQAIFPRVSNLFIHDKKSAESFLRCWRKRLVFMGAGITAAVFIFAPFIVALLTGHFYEQTIHILRIIIFIPFIVSFTNIYLILVLIPLSYTRIYTKIMTISAVINLCSMLPLIYFYGAYGAAVNSIVSELFVACASVYYVRKLHIFPSNLL